MVGEAILSTSFYKTKWNPIPKLYKDSVEKKITDQTHLLKWMKTENKQKMLKLNTPNIIQSLKNNI